MLNKNKILLLLKTPPPYGGGELRNAALKEYVKMEKDFITLEFSAGRLNKSSQGKFELWKIKDFFIQLKQFLRAIKRYKPDLIFFPLPKALFPFIRNSIFFWAARFLHIPCVGELAGMKFSFLERSKIGALYGKFVLSRLRCIRVLGETVACDLKNKGINNTIISDNGVIISPDMQSILPGKGGIIKLLFVGTHSPQKGFTLLLKAIKMLKDKGYSVSLQTLGEWISLSFKDEMERLLKQLEIEDNVIFHGLKFRAQKWQIFSDCQILVLPSYREGQPVVILEALGCGMPIVATCVGAIPDTIKDRENGFLIEPGSADSLANALGILINDPELRKKISNANLDLFKKRYTLDKYLMTQVNWIRACVCSGNIAYGQRFQMKY